MRSLLFKKVYLFLLFTLVPASYADQCADNFRNALTPNQLKQQTKKRLKAIYNYDKGGDYAMPSSYGQYLDFHSGINTKRRFKEVERGIVEGSLDAEITFNSWHKKPMRRSFSMSKGFASGITKRILHLPEDSPERNKLLLMVIEIIDLDSAFTKFKTRATFYHEPRNYGEAILHSIRAWNNMHFKILKHMLNATSNSKMQALIAKKLSHVSKENKLQALKILYNIINTSKTSAKVMSAITNILQEYPDPNSPTDRQALETLRFITDRVLFIEEPFSVVKDAVRIRNIEGFEGAGQSLLNRLFEQLFTSSSDKEKKDVAYARIELVKSVQTQSERKVLDTFRKYPQFNIDHKQWPNTLDIEDSSFLHTFALIPFDSVFEIATAYERIGDFQESRRLYKALLEAVPNNYKHISFIINILSDEKAGEIHKTATADN